MSSRTTTSAAYVEDVSPGTGALPPRAWYAASDAKSLSLNGEWRFRFSARASAEDDSFAAERYDAGDWARRWTSEQLDAARHLTDLTPGETVWVNLDHGQHGIGSQSCGPGPLPQYFLKGRTGRVLVRVLNHRVTYVRQRPVGIHADRLHFAFRARVASTM